MRTLRMVVQAWHCDHIGHLNAGLRLDILLRLAGLVTTRRVGRWIYYSTYQPSLASLERVLSALEPLPPE